MRAQVRRAVVSTLAFAALLIVSVACSPEVPKPKNFVPGVDSAARASNYLIARGESLDPAAVFPLVYLRRKFGIEWADPHIERAARYSREHVDDLRTGVFRRILDPDAEVPASVFRDGSVVPPPEGYKSVYLSVLALYCDKIPDYREAARELSRVAEEEATFYSWAVIAYSWAEELGCATEDATIRERQRLRLVEIAGESTGVKLFEAVALLYYTGERDAIEARWIEKIRETQTSDGWWDSGLDNVSVDVATVWALWALLEADDTRSQPTTWLVVPAKPPDNQVR